MLLLLLLSLTDLTRSLDKSRFRSIFEFISPTKTTTLHFDIINFGLKITNHLIE
jgi:hypothetical protein